MLEAVERVSIVKPCWSPHASHSISNHDFDKHKLHTRAHKVRSREIAILSKTLRRPPRRCVWARRGSNSRSFKLLGGQHGSTARESSHYRPFDWWRCVPDRGHNRGSQSFLCYARGAPWGSSILGSLPRLCRSSAGRSRGQYAVRRWPVQRLSGSRPCLNGRPDPQLPLVNSACPIGEPGLDVANVRCDRYRGNANRHVPARGILDKAWPTGF